MRNNSQKSTLKIIAATSVTIFSLFAAFTGTAAWFNSARALSQTGSEMKIAKPSSVFNSISFHKIVQIDNVPATPVYYFDTAEIANGSADLSDIQGGTANLSFEMDHYTRLRQKNPLLALIELNDNYVASSDLAIRTTLSTTTDSFLASYTAQQVADMTSRPLSNIIKFSAGYLTFDSDGDQGVNTLADVTHTGNMTYSIDGTTTSSSQYYFNEPSSYSSFWEINSSTNEPENVATDPVVFDASNGNKVRYIYIIFDYDIALLEYIYNYFIGEEFLENDLTFNCDWSLEV